MRHSGGLIMAGVGHGKSLIALLAGRVMGAERPVIMCPPGLVPSLKAERDTFSDDFDFGPVSFLPYSTLSTRPEALDDMRPDLIIADEAHKLRHLTSGRTQRVIRYLSGNLDCAFVAMSGSFTGSSLFDYAHLADLALGDKAPIPRFGLDLASWNAVVSPDEVPSPADYGRTEPLRRWASTTGGLQDRSRFAIQERLKTAPGVVMTQDSSASMSLVLRRVRPELPGTITDLMTKVRDTHQLPDGSDFFPDDKAELRCLKQLALGFWYRWEWGDTPTHIREEWLAARADWNRVVRGELETAARAGYDTPGLVRKHVEEHGGWMSSALARWVAIKDEAQPYTVPVWESYDIVEDAVCWAHESSGIIWYRERAFGDAIDIVPVYGAGVVPPTHKHACAMSVQAHGTGRNLQAWSRGLVVSPMSGGQAWEQLLGRQHRAGQRADVVEYSIYQHVEPFRRAFASARADAKYIEETTGQRQKLCYASLVDGNGEV